MRKFRTGAVLVALVLVLAGCASSDGSPTAEPTSPAASSPSDGADLSPTDSPQPTPSDTISPSSDVAGSTELTAWLTQVCAASNQTIDSMPQVDPSQLAKDPQVALQKLQTAYRDLGTRMQDFASRLEQIGAPDVPNGKYITDHFVDDLNAVGQAFASASKALSGKNPQQAMMELAKVMKSSKVQAAFADMKKVGDMLGTKQIRDAAKAIPQCRKANIG